MSDILAVRDIRVVCLWQGSLGVFMEKTYLDMGRIRVRKDKNGICDERRVFYHNT